MAEANNSQEFEISSVRPPSRLTEDVESWCTCAKCQKMAKIKGCVCCRELAILQPFMSKLQCFTGHEDFVAVCLNKSVLRASFASLLECQNRGKAINIIEEEFTNRLLFNIVFIFCIFLLPHISHAHSHSFSRQMLQVSALLRAYGLDVQFRVTANSP